MKIKVTAVSSYSKEIFVEGELLQVIEDLRQGKIDITNVINKNISWLYNKKTNIIDNPKCFIINYDCNDCDVEIQLYDYYNNN